jgi:seryl-tRNA synthetase
MLTLKVINDNPEEVIRRLSKKHFDAKDIVAEIIATDEIRRSTQSFEVDWIAHERGKKGRG